jgi:maltokinase
MATEMRARLDTAASEVPRLAAHADGLAAAYDALAARSGSAEPTRVQRIHGDLHLGQALRTELGWFIVDFEGEPARPLAQRRLPDSPLRDVAGMLRSFDYAAREMLSQSEGMGTQLGYRADEWMTRNQSAFCDGYTETLGADPRDDAVLLRAFEVDKVVYEVLYEAHNRPSWLSIPMAAVRRLSG